MDLRCSLILFDVTYQWFLNAQYACVTLRVLLRSFAALRGLAFAACLPTTFTRPSKYSQLIPRTNSF
jgi:hypothetical protein